MTIRSRLRRLVTDRLFRRRRVERRLTRHLPLASRGVTEVSIVGEATVGTHHRIVLRKEGRRLVLAFDYLRLLPSDRLFRAYRDRPGILIDAFARTNPDVTEVIAEVSDGLESASGVVSFCSGHPGAILVPDFEFHTSRGYASFRARAVDPDPPWSERDPTIVWRGVSTGRGGLIASEDMTPGDSRLIQRSRLCLALRGMPGTDAKLINAVQSPDERRDLARLRAAGILGKWLDPLSWRQRKFALDIDGNSNAWSNLFTRLLLGCCVVKVASPKGYRQWYYKDLRPFEHFVPVAADLSDLAEKIEWCHAHEGECAAIAAAGQEFARERTFDREMAAAVATLNRVFGKPR